LDFVNELIADTIIPVWKDQSFDPPDGSSWYASAAGDRLGFWIKNSLRNEYEDRI